MFVLARAMATRRRGVSIDAFAKEQGWPRTNVYADLKRLTAAGLEITELSTGRYALTEGALASWLDGGNADEMLALFVVKHSLGPLGATAVGRGLDRLWRRLSRRGGQGTLVPAEAATVSVSGPPMIDFTPHAKTIELLERAVAERRCVRLRYRRVDTGEVTERDVEPGFVHIDAAVGGVYFVGWCRLRNDVRYFAVQRIVDAYLLDERVARRPQLAMSAQKRAFRLWWRENVVRVTVAFAPTVAGEIRERTWHPTQRIVDGSDGGVTMSLEVGEPRELLRWLLGFGADVEVVEPALLADELRRAHARAAASAAPLLRSGAESRSRPARPTILVPLDGTAPSEYRTQPARRRRS